MEQPNLTIAPGEIVCCQGQTYQIVKLVDMLRVLARNVTNQFIHCLPIEQLQRVGQESGAVASQLPDLSILPTPAWEAALHKYTVLKSIIENGCQLCDIAAAAGPNNVHRSTIYRWLRQFKSTGYVSSLVARSSDGGKGKSRLLPEVEALIDDSLTAEYLSKQRLNVLQVCRAIKMKCKTAGLPPPGANTVRRRIAALSEETKMARRMDKSVAAAKYSPLQGHFSEAEYPLSLVQIDHTLLDIIVVDDLCRQPVGRPWITIGIDVFSRMITGFYISLDPPGALSTGLCLSHCILPKEMWLAKLDVAGNWPCYGVMRSLHLDNAKEFHGCMLERACQEYGILVNFRPVKQPKYGGHIERLLGTVLQEIHSLPGTTFSNSEEKKHYDSSGKACFTLTELEKWLATYIVNVYHQRLHKGLQASPYAKYTEGILGSASQPGTGLRRPLFDEVKLKLDFMPFVERTIQQYGVSIDNVTYYHDVLRRWIHSHAEETPKSQVKRKFIFKRDPRDISVVFFYDPDVKSYFAIPYRDPSLPPITIWEHREMIRQLKAKGCKEIDEENIFESYRRLKESEENASKTTHQTRKKQTRSKQALQNSIKSELIPSKQEEAKEGIRGKRGRILPFEDLNDEPFK